MDKTISILLQITFFSGDENSSKRLKLEAEWNNFKYELSDWSKDHQAIPSLSTTSTEWALQRFLTHKESYHRSYPLLLQVAEICLSMPVSNAWPERGASALKRLKTRLRNSLKKEMIESLLHISINVHPVKESEAVINKAVEGKEAQRKTATVFSSSAKLKSYAKCTRRAGSGGRRRRSRRHTRIRNTRTAKF